MTWKAFLFFFGTPAIHLYAAQYFVRSQSPGSYTQPWPSVGLPSDFWRTTWWSLLPTDRSASPKGVLQLPPSVFFCQRFWGLHSHKHGLKLSLIGFTLLCSLWFSVCSEAARSEWRRQAELNYGKFRSKPNSLPLFSTTSLSPPPPCLLFGGVAKC